MYTILHSMSYSDMRVPEMVLGNSYRSYRGNASKFASNTIIR